MPENLPPHAQRWAALLQDAIATDSAIREGLHDDDAVPFVEWGRAHAARVAARWVAQGITPDEEQLDEAAGALMDLMTNINWAVRYRGKKGTAWTVNILRSLNGLNRQLLGDDAPTLDEETLAAWVTGNLQRADGQVLRDLLARLTPPAQPPTAPPLPGRPPHGAASALGESPEPAEQTGENQPGSLLGQLAETAHADTPASETLSDALGHMGETSDDTSHEQTLGGFLGKRIRRILPKRADDVADTHDLPSDSAPSSGENHDQAE